MTIGLNCSSSILAQHTVLLASVGSRKALAMAQSLKAFGARVLGVTHYTTDPHCFSRFFDRVLVLREVDRKSVSWAVRVAEIAAAQGAELVIPVDFVDVVTFSSYAGVFEKLGTRLAAPEANAVLEASRKGSLAKLVGDVVRVPRSVTFTAPSEVEIEAVKRLQLPLVVKGLGDASHPEYFSSYELAAERAKERAPCLVQEYVAGRGRGYFAVASNGDVLMEFTHERIYEYDPAGGASVAARGPILDPRLFRLGREIVRRLEWTGPLMVETKWVPATGEYYLLELNPKFWGSLALPVSLGYHFPAALAVAYLKGVDAAKEFCKHLMVQSGEYYFLLDGLFYLFRIPETWAGMLARSRIVRSDIDLTDPARVAVQSLIAMVGGLRSRREWKRGLAVASSRLKATLKLSKPIAGVVFDLDGTLVRLKVPWSEVRQKLCSEGLLYEWESIRKGFTRLWYSDENLYYTASRIVEGFEREYLHNMEILVNVNMLNDIKQNYELGYYIVTFQAESVAKDIVQRMGLRVDLILGRDSGFGPVKENTFHKGLNYRNNGNFVAFDDDLTNIISALRAGFLSVLVTENKYNKIHSLRLGIPFAEPEHLHDAILSLL
jgi:predicted ATP-grasp superfamily ATP-dependent carboligase/beta-phosphoglucomutase-like phosphatase (HAD superfamily)